MKSIVLPLLCILFTCGILLSQPVKWDAKNLEPIGVQISVEKLEGKEALRVVKDQSLQQANLPTFVKIKGSDFRNGMIEVKVLSRLLKDAGEGARGFIGVAFRIADDNYRFEGLYIRPTNGRAEDQLRRNHSTQYFSYPDFDFDRLRKEAPGVYESYADMGLNEWITIRIEVKDTKARLYINNTKQPCLIVNDLKHGDSSGAIGLWVENGTEGFFTDLKVQKDK